MDQPRKIIKPARGQLNREIKCPCRRILRGKYVYMYCCLHLFIYQVHLLFGDTHTSTFVHGSVLYTHNICVTTAVCVYVYIYMAITYNKGKDRPGKVSNPAQGHLAEQGK